MDGALGFLKVGLTHYLVFGALLFALGLFTIASRRNAIGILLGVELVLNAAAVNFVAFAQFSTGAISGHIFAVFIIVLAAAEAAVGLAIVLSLFQNTRSISADRADTMKE